MKRFLFSLLAISCTGLGCAPERTDVFIQGVVVPTADPTTKSCTFAPGDATKSKVEGLINVGAQKQINGGLLSAVYGFQVQNTVSTPPSQTPPGVAANTQNRDDAIFKALEITATDDSNQVLATETVTAGGYAPHNGQGVAVGDVVSKKLQDALLARSDSFTMHLGVKAKGTFVAGTDFETGEFSFPVQVIYGGGVLNPTDGGAPIIPPGTSHCE